MNEYQLYLYNLETANREWDKWLDVPDDIEEEKDESLRYQERD